MYNISFDKRLEDVKRFYEILEALENKLGGKRTLANCNGRMGWPEREVYFFFELGEYRSTSGVGMRVVRVGTHALTEKSKTTLWNRLSQHQGTIKSGGGNHRGSIFRHHVGTALIARDVRGLFQTVAETFGRLDILINNAGVETLAPFLELEEDQWDCVYNTNVKGIYLCTQLAARMMKDIGGGVVVNISSTTGQQVWTGYAHYCSSKAAVDMLTKCLAVELAPFGIVVNAIAPGTVDTEMTQQDISGEGLLDIVIRRTPIKRLGTPEDIARSVLFLCEGAGNWLTGEIITVDGGYRLSGDPIPG
jgi:NAD(P)-dependent dehydrogenase (short-subunit alcohol dehydrogenase family)